jgi:putative nucleotidyltransferase with HDIG domain
MSDLKEEATPSYRDAAGEYLPVSVEGLSSGLSQDLDLFAKIGEGYFIVKPRNVDLDQRLISRFKGQDPYLFIRSVDRDKYFTKLDSTISKVIKDPSLPVRDKAGVLTDYAVEIIDQLYKDPANPRSVTAAKSLTQECVRLISQSRHAFLHLVELSSHDQYTYAHSVGVAAYTIALAPEVMNPTPEQLVDMGLAGLLHDLGKCQVDPAIINKRGPLSEDEWSVMKRHPEWGAEILSKHKQLNPLIPLAAEAHHETLVGTGYPKGLVATRLDPLVRIVSLSDAFSALTTKRSYSTARDSLTAFKILRDQVEKKFDPALFKPFVKLFLDPRKQQEAA